jgi:hypothetical protein
MFLQWIQVVPSSQVPQPSHPAAWRLCLCFLQDSAVSEQTCEYLLPEAVSVQPLTLSKSNSIFMACDLELSHLLVPEKMKFQILCAWGT